MTQTYADEIDLFEKFGLVAEDEDQKDQDCFPTYDNSPGYLQKPGRSNRKFSPKGKKHDRNRDWD